MIEPWWSLGSHRHAEIRRRTARTVPLTVTLGRGTMEREEEIKRTATCPTCGRRYADSLTRWDYEMKVLKAWPRRRAAETRRRSGFAPNTPHQASFQPGNSAAAQVSAETARD